jgi:opacity protein-like surface antigen
LAAPSATAGAQDFNPFEIGGAIGAAIPVGDLDDAANVGYNATFILGYKPTFSPLGFRFDAAYNQFGLEAGGDVDIPSFTANAVFELPTGGFTPYVIGGAGLYRVDEFFVFPGESQNKFGWNAGAGISMPLSGFRVFVEARYNQVNLDGPDATFVPITFGAIF